MSVTSTGVFEFLPFKLSLETLPPPPPPPESLLAGYWEEDNFNLLNSIIICCSLFKSSIVAIQEHHQTASDTETFLLTQAKSFWNVIPSIDLLVISLEHVKLMAPGQAVNPRVRVRTRKALNRQ